MKFVASSTDLLSHLQAISRVISTKNTLPILDNFLFELRGNELVITASDLESTMITTMSLENTDGEGVVAIPAKILIDTLKEFPEQPLTFEINMDSLGVDLVSENGKYSIVGKPGMDFPQLPQLKEDQTTSLNFTADQLLMGINKTLFATADDELRPVMNGIFIELGLDCVTFVSSDAHKLVRYKRLDAKSAQEASFILPKKPANLLKNILPREQNEVSIAFDDKNAIFSLSDYKLICRLVEGNYPGYGAVIPDNNTNKLYIDRLELYNTLRRVSVYSNQASNLIKLKLSANELVISAQDIDYSISAHETLNCQYGGDPMEIGFKSVFLIEILSNINSDEVVLELSDPTRAGLLLPKESDQEDEDLLMLLMPMMINA
ncbi:MAG: DNA polymerase III subunit beta [Bacteroidales bacterium]|nr:DNA polymerase III subunit beta [Bacteroidales bacterium]